MAIRTLTSILKDERPLRNYQVTYRIADERTSSGTRQQRYDDLVGLLDDLPAVLRRGHFEDDAHIATSSWLVQSRNSAPALGRKLSRRLTPGIDLLEIVQVSVRNRFELTVEAPKPQK